MNKWLERMKEYYRDKKLAEKCGLEVKDICTHESDGSKYDIGWLGSGGDNHKCIKCGEFYR